MSNALHNTTKKEFLPQPCGHNTEEGEINLLPVPPLDGSAVIQLFMPEDWARRYQELFLNPMWSMVGLVAAWRLLFLEKGVLISLALTMVLGAIAHVYMV